MTLASATLWYVVSLAGLIMISATITDPMAQAIAASGTGNSTSLNTTGYCDERLFDDQDEVIGNVSIEEQVVTTAIGGIITALIGPIIFIGAAALWFLFPPEEPADSRTCDDDGAALFSTVNLLDGTALAVSVGLLILVGALVLGAGFLTAGSSRGAFALITWGAIIAGALAVGISLVSPLFDVMIPDQFLADLALAFYGLIGFLLVFSSGLSYLSGGGD